MSKFGKELITSMKQAATHARGRKVRGIGGFIQYIPASPPQEQIRAVTQTAKRISRKLGWGFR